jgi:hypothetical protein
MKTFSKGTVAKDPKTGRFVSVASMKTLHIAAKRTPKAPEALDPATVEIFSAQYGIDGSRVSVIVKIGDRVNNRLAGTDPAPKQRKTLVVLAKVNGAEVEKAFREGTVVTF